MAADSDDFAELRRQAQAQDAAKQEALSRERASKERAQAAKQAAQDAKDKAERDRAREVLKLREEQQKRRKEDEERLAKQREELKRQRAEQVKQAALKGVKSERESPKVVTKKMIKIREKAGLGKGSSSGKESSSYEHLPLTRQEKRERKEREALGILGKHTKPINTNGKSPVSAALARYPKNTSTTMHSPVASTSTLPPARQPVKASPSSLKPSVQRSPAITGLEKQLDSVVDQLAAASSLPFSKDSSAKVRMLEAQEKELKRKLAMAKKQDEQRQLDMIRNGQAGKAVAGEPSRSSASAKGETLAEASRMPTARERFLLEEEQRKTKRKESRSQSPPQQRKKNKSMDFEESFDEDSDQGTDDDDDDDDSIDGFIDDDEPEEAVDIWSIMNPGKDKKKYMSRALEDSDDDMEADLDTLRREELRSTIHGRDEDRREEELLRKHDREKAERKRLAAERAKQQR